MEDRATRFATRAFFLFILGLVLLAVCQMIVSGVKNPNDTALPSEQNCIALNNYSAPYQKIERMAADRLCDRNETGWHLNTTKYIRMVLT